MTTEFNPGDKVRVTYEVIVRETFGDYWKTINKNGTVHWVQDYASVELIERGDDPSKDLVGTVRENQQGDVFVKMLDGEVTNYPWDKLGSTVGIRFRDDQMIGAAVTGVVPGSPADTSQKQDVEPDTEYYEFLDPDRFDMWAIRNERVYNMSKLFYAQWRSVISRRPEDVRRDTGLVRVERDPSWPELPVEEA